MRVAANPRLTQNCNGRQRPIDDGGQHGDGRNGDSHRHNQRTPRHNQRDCPAYQEEVAALERQSISGGRHRSVATPRDAPAA